jgi:tryptophan synthase alpha chain
VTRATTQSPVTEAITTANNESRLALAVFLTAGWPTRDAFTSVVRSVARHADIVEIGVPFSDPMADGVTIQEASHHAIRDGVTLDWILETVTDLGIDAPVLLMSYLNPLLAFGIERLGDALVDARVSGCIVPDLPLEESAVLRAPLRDRGLDLVQLVSPATPPGRLETVCRASHGFVYAVTVTGTTGGSRPMTEEVRRYLERVRRASPIPVLAGFGIRTPEQIIQLHGHAHGVIVGTALIEALRQNEDPTPFLESLWNATHLHTRVNQ